jgi:hypothetical protein
MRRFSWLVLLFAVLCGCRGESPFSRTSAVGGFKHMPTATQVYNDGGAISGVLTISNQDQRTPLVEDHAYTELVSVGFRGASVVIQNVPWYPAPPPGEPEPGPGPGDPLPEEGEDTSELIFKRSITGYPFHSPAPYDYIRFSGPGPWTLSTAFSISVRDARLWREEALRTGTGRDGTPVLADDVSYADEWLETAERTYDVTFGPLSASGTHTGPVANFVTIAQWQLEADAGSYPCEYSNVTVNWDDVEVNFSGCSETYGPGDWRARGDGNRLVFEALQEFDVQYTYYQSGWTHLAPLIVAFRPNVYDRTGNLVDDVRLSVPSIQASLEVPDSLTWSTTP